MVRKNNLRVGDLYFYVKVGNLKYLVRDQVLL